MIKDKQGTIYTLCFDCAPQDFIPCLNPDQEECDACGRVAKQVSYSSTLPGSRERNDPARIAARAIIKNMNKPPKIPRSKK